MDGQQRTGGFTVRQFKDALTRAVFEVHDRSGAFLDMSPDDVLFGCTADALARDAEGLSYLLRMLADGWRRCSGGGAFALSPVPAAGPPKLKGKAKPRRKKTPTATK